MTKPSLQYQKLAIFDDDIGYLSASITTINSNNTWANTSFGGMALSCLNPNFLGVTHIALFLQSEYASL